MTFGSELKPNEFGAINGYVEKQIDVYAGLYKVLTEKAAAERDYGTKILDLARTFQQQLENLHDKKADSAANTLALTETEAAATTPLELLPAANEWVLQLEEEGRLHMQLASKISGNVAEDLHSAFNSLGDARKKSLDFYQKLLGERDKIYDQKDKARANYETKSKALGSSQSRQERATNEKDQDKYRIKADKNSSARNQAKNEYILQVAVANAVKDAVSHQFTPKVMDSMQTINEQRVTTTKRLLLQLLEMQETADGKRIQRTQRVAHVMNRVTPEADSQAYVRKRIEGGLSKWEEQPDFRVIVDYANGEQDSMARDGESQVILKNMCLQADRERTEADQKLRVKNTEAEKHRLQSQTPGPGADKAIEKAAEAQHEATMLELEIVKHKAVRAAIETELGSVDSGNPHEFKSFTVAISKTCDYCDESIGGLNRKAAKCAACGYTCHAKCQIKVAPNCEGPDPEAKSGFLSRFGTKKNKKGKHARAASAVSGVSMDSDNTPDPVSNSASMSASQASLPRNPTSYGAAAGTAAATLPRRSTSHTPYEPTPRSASISRGTSAAAGAGAAAAGAGAAAVAGAGAASALASVMAGRRAASEIPSTHPAADLVTVTYDYDGDGTTTLSVRAGDKVRVLVPDDENRGWIRADVNGQIGLVPTSYVNMDEYNPHTSPVLPPRSSNSYRSPSISQQSWSQQPSGDEYVVAVYDFAARDEEELSFSAGDKIRITSRDVGAGWLQGTIYGQTGRFPESYVKDDE